MYEAGVTIRRPKKGDEADLALLIYRFYLFNEEFDPAWSLSDNAKDSAITEAARLVSQRENGEIVLVAEINGSLVGYVRGFIRTLPLLSEGSIAVISELYVKPGFRGRGVGKLLIDAFSDEARRMNASRIAAEVPSQNIVAEKFYEKLGFRKFMITFVKEV